MIKLKHYPNRYSKKLLDCLETTDIKSAVTHVSHIIFPNSFNSRDELFDVIMDACADLFMYKDYDLQSTKFDIILFLALLPNKDLMEILDQIHIL